MFVKWLSKDKREGDDFKETKSFVCPNVLNGHNRLRFSQLDLVVDGMGHSLDSKFVRNKEFYITTEPLLNLGERSPVIKYLTDNPHNFDELREGLGDELLEQLTKVNKSIKLSAIEYVIYGLSLYRDSDYSLVLVFKAYKAVKSLNSIHLNKYVTLLTSNSEDVDKLVLKRVYSIAKEYDFSVNNMEEHKVRPRPVMTIS